MKKAVKNGFEFKVLGIDEEEDNIFLEDKHNVFKLLSETEASTFNIDKKYVGSALLSYSLVKPYIVEINESEVDE